MSNYYSFLATATRSLQQFLASFWIASALPAASAQTKTSHRVPLEKCPAHPLRRGAVLTVRYPAAASHNNAIASLCLSTRRNRNSSPPRPKRLRAASPDANRRDQDRRVHNAARSTRGAASPGQPWAPQARPRRPSCWAPARRGMIGGRDRPNRSAPTTPHPRSRRRLEERPAPPP